MNAVLDSTNIFGPINDNIKPLAEVSPNVNSFCKTWLRSKVHTNKQ